MVRTQQRHHLVAQRHVVAARARHEVRLLRRRDIERSVEDGIGTLKPILIGAVPRGAHTPSGFQADLPVLQPPKKCGRASRAATAVRYRRTSSPMRLRSSSRANEAPTRDDVWCGNPIPQIGSVVDIRSTSADSAPPLQIRRRHFDDTLHGCTSRSCNSHPDAAHRVHGRVEHRSPSAVGDILPGRGQPRNVHQRIGRRRSGARRAPTRG